ncbi:hypothetical protein [Micromonospora sp. NPDC051006]|uniref:hypothetical protein n=1 Tax=Micromonospora sp. NPDC051006 TaxID=3364283 RepID=UPI00379B98A8
MNDCPIRVILDASAILAFTRESIDVGEVIAEVADEGCHFGLPVLCLAESSRAVADRDRLDLLVNHPAAALLTIDPASWQALAVVYDTVGRLDAASALLAAVDNGCNVLTGQPGLYGGLAGGGPIIPL